MKLDPNSPTFPVPNDANVNGQPGLPLRAHFAGLAMQGMLANPGTLDVGVEQLLVHVPANSVRMADALITELNKDAPPPREARDGEVIGWAVKHGIRDLSNKDLRAAFEAARNLDLSKP
jgi:hypothetical protein